MTIEELVYGTFPFTQGFTLVSASPGLATPLSRQIVEVCKSWGEVHDADFRRALYHVPLWGEEAENEETEDQDAPPLWHLVGKVTRQGTDGGGRMAWYHQVLAINHGDYLAAGADCFAFNRAGLFKDRWFEKDGCSTHFVDREVIPNFSRADMPEQRLAMIEEIAKALVGGHRLRTTARRDTTPMRLLFREAINMLPATFRAALSVSTFSFRSTRQYDLSCVYDSAGSEVKEIGDISFRLKPGGSATLGADESVAETLTKAFTLLRAGKIDNLDTLLDEYRPQQRRD